MFMSMYMCVCTCMYISDPGGQSGTATGGAKEDPGRRQEETGGRVGGKTTESCRLSQLWREDSVHLF